MASDSSYHKGSIQDVVKILYKGNKAARLGDIKALLEGEDTRAVETREGVLTQHRTEL